MYQLNDISPFININQFYNNNYTNIKNIYSQQYSVWFEHFLLNIINSLYSNGLDRSNSYQQVVPIRDTQASTSINLARRPFPLGGSSSLYCRLSPGAQILSATVTKDLLLPVCVIFTPPNKPTHYCIYFLLSPSPICCQK